ncbi:MAG: hypothetical protein QXY84_04245 [Candidatus Caldarchaeum sp.]|uniref:Uncharacterized protein n=1 Tax=Caldiarchaeum subterraneum TaxID=311458 RepID=A0A7C5YAC5_CALS0
MAIEESEEVKGWRNAFLLLFLVAATFFLLERIVGFQLTFTFLFFSVYLPLVFTGAVYLLHVLRRLRR